MLSFISKRLLVALLVCLTVSALSFGLMFVSGDPAIAIAGAGGRAEDAEAIRQAYGFDRPLVVQYLDWIGSALTGNLGQSIYFNVPVTEIIGNRAGVTLALGFISFLVALVIAVPLGRRGAQAERLDRPSCAGDRRVRAGNPELLVGVDGYRGLWGLVWLGPHFRR